MKIPLTLSSSAGPRSASPRWWDLTLAALALGWSLLFFFTFRPGLMSYDSIDTYRQGVSGNFGNWHPPLISFLYGLSARAVGSPWPILAVQLALLAGGMALLARAVPRARAAFALVVLVAYLASPPVWSIAVTLWKDGAMAAAMIGAVVALRAGRRGLTYALLFLAVLCRHNALFAAVPLVLPIVAGPGRRGARVALGAAAILLLAGAPKIADKVFSARDEWTLGALFIFDEVAVYHADPSMLADSPYSTELTPKDVEMVYWPRSAQPIFSGVPQAHQMTSASLAPRREAITHEWFRVLRAHPRVYAKHRWLHFIGLLAADGGPVCYPFHVGVDKNPWGFHLPEPTRLYNGLRKLQDATANSLFFRGWFWMAVLTVLGALAFWRRAWLAGWVATSGWCYGAAYLLVGMVCDFRYLYWSVVACFAALLVWLASPARPKAA